MGRVRTYIHVNGRKCWTLFDSGADNSCVIPEVAGKLEIRKLVYKRITRLGGRIHKVTHKCDLIARLEGRPVQIESLVVDRIGRDTLAGRDFEILVGARAMQDWGIELSLKKEKLDLCGYPGENVEF